ncbi:MAG: uroporphyrinogen decarboxylase family protein [Victivallales bacterium]
MLKQRETLMTLIKKMTYRERFHATVNHKPVDRVPFDLGATAHTTIASQGAKLKFQRFLGIQPVGCGNDWYHLDESILRHFDIDFRAVGNLLEPHGGVAKKISDTENVDSWGIRRVFTGLYWDIVEPPLKGAAIEDLEKYPWPRVENISRKEIDAYRREAKRLYEETPYVVCALHPVLGVLELGCWMCGFDDFMLKMAMEPDFVRRFFDIILDYQKKTIEIYYGAIGEFIHVTTSGDDFGTQNGPFISPDMFSQLVAPYYKERIAHTRRYTKAKYFHHTCGAVFPIVPHLIDAGVDILNPIQPGAKDMEPAKLKAAYGGQLTFWGGIDTQHVLPEGMPEDVEREVFHVLDAMGGNGGYVLAPAHNIQVDVPPRNIAAIYEAGRKYHAGK